MALKRSLFQVYLKTGMTTGENPTEIWSLVGPGVSSLNITYNPDEESQQYVNEDTATSTVKGYKPTIDLSAYYEGTVASGIYTLDSTIAYLHGLKLARKIGTEADSEILLAYLFTATSFSASTGWSGVVTQRQKINIRFGSDGGEASSPLTFDATFAFAGDPVSTGTSVVSVDKKTITYTAS